MNKTQFFDYLASGGAVRMISYRGEQVPNQTRKHAVKVQSNGVKFSDDSWLYKADVKAADFRDVAAGGELPAVSVGWAVYQLEGRS